MFKQQVNFLKGFLIPTSLILLTEIIISSFKIQSDSIAAPSSIAQAFYGALIDGSLMESTLYTLHCVFYSILIAMLIGVPLGILFGLSRRIYTLFSGMIEIMRPIPSIALMPLAMLILGIGYKMEVAVVVFACIWPILLMSIHATQQIEKRHIEVAKTLRLGTLKSTLSIYIPSILPRMMVALRLACTVALVVAITVEVSGNPEGLGNFIINAQQSINPELMWAALIWIACIGWLMNLMLVKLNQWLFQPEITGASV